MAPSKKKSKRGPSSDCSAKLDRISNLPEDVLNQILSKLCLKDSAKTSVLSTKWRYKYATRSSLVFDCSLVDDSKSHADIAETNRLVSLIDRVLLLHSGPVHKFKLSLNFPLPTEEIEKWILFVSRRNPKVFAFVGATEFVKTSFRVSSSLFSCQSLTNLKLCRCSLQLPSTFGGFKNLTSLRLSEVEVDKDVLESLISSSPLLERLTIDCCSYIENLCINAPNIQHISLERFFMGISLQNTPHLSVLSMDADQQDEKCEDGIYFKKLLVGMPQIQELNIGREYLRCMTIGDVPRDIQVSLLKLHHMSVGVNFDEIKETLYLLRLLNCAPNLQELNIESEGYWKPSISRWASENTNGPFTCLRYIKLNGILGSEAEMDFIKFMLLSSLALETITIGLDAYTGSRRENITREKVTAKVANQLLSFSRASLKAKIIIS